LPYSGANFVLPPNLYILGTMNTADKSLALLDVALRRRFKFIEYSPDFSVCRQLSDKTRKILAELNHRIVLSKDRDHRIGHSFFVKVKSEEEFNEVFRFDIIPLLQEYFYNDWDGLRFVLGEDGENGKFIRALKSEKTRGVRNRWQWYFDEREDHSFNSLQTLMANYFAPKPADDNANGST
jgi:5-methylcytosine-specific restriction endonuclease McrBC GTP-binding regulatory subunit McrB